MEYKPVERIRLQSAFAAAHKASEDLTIPIQYRKKFRAIAMLIWDGCGEGKRPPRGAGAKLAAVIEQATGAIL